MLKSLPPTKFGHAGGTRPTVLRLSFGLALLIWLGCEQRTSADSLQTFTVEASYLSYQWAPIELPTDVGSALYTLTVDPTSATHLYMPTWSAGSYDSRDAGLTWTPVATDTLSSYLGVDL